MRHRVVGRKLSRTASHRRALLRSLSTELIRHKRITTTEAKAKEASRFVERLISKARRAWNAEQDGGAVNLHARRIVGRDIQDKNILKELFTTVAEKVAERPGGYTRVIRIGQRNGDGAEMAVLELVDYNMERDENAVRSRSKNLMSRAERVRRSQEKQKQKEEAKQETETVVAAEDETMEEVAENVEASSEAAAEEVEAQTEEVVAEEETAEAAADDEAAEEAEEAPATEEEPAAEAKSDEDDEAEEKKEDDEKKGE